MNKPEQTTIIQALAKAEISYDDIRFHQNGKVTIRQNVTDSQTIQLAQAGIFSPLKSQAIKIWDTLGSSRETGESDIEYFVVFMAEGNPQAVFTIYPDMARAAYNAQEKVPNGWTESREEVLLEAAIEVEGGSDIEEVVKTVIQSKFKATTIQSIRSASIRFKKDILGLISPEKDKRKCQQSFMIGF